MLLVCMFMSCVYFAFDNPAALHDQLRDHFRHMPQTEFEYQFNLLYSAYSLPNVILPFFGGVFVDRYGAENCCLVFLCIISIGQLLVSVGVSIQSFPIMLFGRAVFGVGGESVMVASSMLLQSWFRHGEIALAMGLSLSVSRLGSVSNNLVSPWLAKRNGGVKSSFFFSTLVLGLSVVAASVLKLLGKRADKTLRSRGYETSEDGAADSDSNIGDLWGEVKRAKNFSSAYWLMTTSCIVIYGTVLPFNNVASALLIEKFICKGPCCGVHFKQCHRAVSAEATASYVMGIPFMVSAFVTPVIGIIVDKCGGNTIMTTVAAVILFGVHLTIRLSSAIPYWPLFFQGLAYAMYAAALWPAIGASVKKDEGGMAYGLTTAMQNIGLAMFPILVAGLRSKYGNYDGVELLFVGLACAGICLGVLQVCIEFSRQRAPELTSDVDNGNQRNDDPFANLGNDFEETRGLLHRHKAEVRREGGLQSRP